MNRKVIAILVVALMAVTVQVSLIVDSFPGFHSFGDCTLCHNEPATAYNSSYMSSSITLDGNHTEEFWDGDMTYGRRQMVPFASNFGGTHGFLSVVFAQNSSHFFMLTGWEDATINGTDQNAYAAADGIAVMFNINVTDFTPENFGGMATKNAGEAVDVFVWKPAASETGTQLPPSPNRSDSWKTVTGNTYDYLIDSDGWVRSETQNVLAAATHGNVSEHNEHNYQVEFARALETGDANDVQFSESGYYEFAFALFNESSGGGHYVTFGHSVWVYNGEPEPEVTTVTVPTTIQETDVETITTTESAGLYSFLAIAMVILVSSAVALNYTRLRKF